MCPIACLLNPLEHIIHTYHIETSSKQSRTCASIGMHALAGLQRVTCTALQGPCMVLFFCFFLIDKCSVTETLISFSLKHMRMGVCTQSALVQMRQRSQTTMLRDGCYSKWPNGKTKGLIFACLCASALRGAVVQWVKGDDAATGRSGEWSTAVEAIMRLYSPRLVLAYYSH